MVFVLVVAAAVVTLLDGDVANRLSLPWAPNAPRSDEPSARPVSLSIKSADGGGHVKPQAVSAALAKTVGAKQLGKVSGVVVDPETGETLWQQDPAKPLPPASTTKLLTASAALLSLPASTTLKTTVVAGQKPGEVVLVAGGDLTLASGSKGLYPGAARLDDLARQVRKASGGKVSEVSVDTSLYDPAPRAPGWSPSDAPSTYAAPMAPVMLDGGRQNPTDPEGQRSAKPVDDVASELAKRLGASVGTVGLKAPKGAKRLGQVSSAPLPELIETALQDSDNVLAETIARQVAIKAGQPASFAGGAKATLAVLRKNGFDTGGVTLADGSGLSRNDKVPARLLTSILAEAAGKGSHSAKLRPLLSGLPVAGGTGTLADRFDKASAKGGRGWVRAKTGTLSAVNTLAGDVLDDDGDVLVFAFMSSGTNPADARPALDDVAAALRQCGCR